MTVISAPVDQSNKENMKSYNAPKVSRPRGRPPKTKVVKTDHTNLIQSKLCFATITKAAQPPTAVAKPPTINLSTSRIGQCQRGT